MKHLFFATQNRGKQLEIQAAFEGMPDLIVQFPQDVSGLETVDPDETGDSLEANAKIKAEAFLPLFTKATLPDLIIAEDSGLEVKVLDGKPGVHSKRFHPGSDADRNTELLRLLSTKSDRSAQFRAVLWVIATSDGSSQLFEGVVTGQIANQPAGDQGFGFDPLFVPDGYSETFAQLGSEVKLRISHRARALEAFKKSL